MESKRVEVELQLYFIRTRNEGSEDDQDYEYDLSSEELDQFMKSTPFWGVKGSRYKHYVESIMFGMIKDVDLIDLEVSYQDECKLTFSFNLDGCKYKTLEEIKDDILHQSFEDGMYEAAPGAEAVVHTKNLYNGEYEELGLIDCRNEDTIKVNYI